MDEVVEVAEGQELADLVGWVADEQGSADVVGLAAGLDEDLEERGVSERHAREVQHDRLPWGEVRLDGALEVVEARHVDLAPQSDDRHLADFYLQVAGHGARPYRQVGTRVAVAGSTVGDVYVRTRRTSSRGRCGLPRGTELIDERETSAAFVRRSLEHRSVCRTILHLDAYLPVDLHHDLEGGSGMAHGVRGEFAQGQGEFACDSGSTRLAITVCRNTRASRTAGEWPRTAA